MASPFDLFHTYLRAFKLGTSDGAIGEWHVKARDHADPAIRLAWADGWEAGQEARAGAVRHASEAYGYRPNILRIQPLHEQDETP